MACQRTTISLFEIARQFCASSAHVHLFKEESSMLAILEYIYNLYGTFWPSKVLWLPKSHYTLLIFRQPSSVCWGPHFIQSLSCFPHCPARACNMRAPVCCQVGRGGVQLPFVQSPGKWPSRQSLTRSALTSPVPSWTNMQITGNPYVHSYFSLQGV